MILIRVEPESVGPLGMDVDARRESWLSGFKDNEQKERMRVLYQKRGMDHFVGCWFSAAMSRTDGKLDAIIYANEIIGPDNNYDVNPDVQTKIRIIALNIDDEIAERFLVSKLSADSYARVRSAIPDAEYVVPNNLPQLAQILLTLEPGEKLTEERYMKALSELKAVPIRPNGDVWKIDELGCH